jgi:hypothetical protein
MSSIQLYPNPATATITLSAKEAAIQTVSVLAIDGKMLMNKVVQNTESKLDISFTCWCVSCKHETIEWSNSCETIR